MAELLKGAPVAASLKEKLKEAIETEKITPKLAIVRVGCKGSDLAYEKGVTKTCDSVGIKTEVFEFPEDISQVDLENAFAGINSDDSIHGILFFKPLPKHLDEKAFDRLIDPEKDMDCMSPANWAKLSTGDESGYYPCTAEAVVKMIEYAGKDITGANAVILGRSQVIGKPLGLMLLKKNATVTWCHSKTKDIPYHCQGADILVSACGAAGLVRREHAEHTADGCVALDVGMNFVDGKMCGDFAFDEVEPYVGMITPVPGGVGSVTNTIMASHVVRAAIKAEKGKIVNF